MGNEKFDAIVKYCPNLLEYLDIWVEGRVDEALRAAMGREIKSGLGRLAKLVI